jgi:hypothetical protein
MGIYYENIDDGRTVVVRKKCRCEWCGEWILSGEKAVKRTYKYDGEFNDNRQHPECYEAMDADLEAKLEGFQPYDQERPKALATLAEKSA